MKTRRRRALLRVYSPSFRSRYGDEMLDALDAEDFGQSRTQRFANDIDFARNGVAQRFGSDVVADIEGGMRWVGLVALATCVMWSTVSLISSNQLVGPVPINLRMGVLWIIVLAASIGRLLLPRRGAHVAWFIGLFAVVGSTYLGYQQREALPSDLYLGTPAYLLRWQTAAIALLLLLGAAAPIGLRRSSIVSTSLGILGGIGLAIRFSTIGAFSLAPRFSYDADGYVSYSYTAIRVPTFANLVTRGTFVDLARVDLLPNFGWWWLIGLICLASIGLLRPTAAVSAVVAATVSLGAAVFFNGMSGVQASLRYVIPTIVIVESTVILVTYWRRQQGGQESDSASAGPMNANAH